MIIVHCHFYLKEDSEFLSYVINVINSTLKEEGCISYGLANEVTNTTHYVMVEKWASKEALQKHLKTEHFAVFDNYVKKISKKEAKLEVFEANEITL